MEIFRPAVIILILLINTSVAKKVDEDAKSLPEDDWIDPFDMIHYNGPESKKVIPEAGKTFKGDNVDAACNNIQTQLSQCRKDLENLPVKHQACPKELGGNMLPCDTPYFKKLVRRILENLEAQGEHEVVVEASIDETATLRKFVESEKGNVQDVWEIVSGIMSNFKSKDDLPILSFWDSTKFSYITQEAVIVLAFFVALVFAVVIFETRTRLPWRTQLWCLLFLCFVVSIPWEWFHLYRKAFASKQAQMEKDIPKHCRPDHELHPWESLMLWLKSSFTFSDDVCIKYQENLLVDPIWEISPSRAISATIASTIAQPFEHMAETIGKSFRALFKEVPIQWQPFVFIAVIVIIILAMFMLSGLEIRLPFITIATRPALPGNAAANMQRLEQQVQNVEAILQQLNEAPRDRVDQAPAVENINNRDVQILQLLQEMGERQERWQNELQRRVEPAIEGVENQQPPRGEEEGGFIMVEERPVRPPVRENSGLKLPVQNTEHPSVPVEELGLRED